MRRCFAYVAGIILTLTISCFAQEEQFLNIYLIIQEADGLITKNQPAKAAAKYVEARDALKKFQADYPDWHQNIVKFRQNYIAEKLAPIAEQLSATKPAPAPVANKDANAASVAAPLAENTLEIQGLRQQIDGLTKQNAELQAKLKEAFSVQPAAVDPKQLAKAEEEITTLKKERDLLKSSLEQATAKKPEDQSVAGQEKKLVDDITAKLAQQTELVASLQKENDILKSQIIAIKGAEARPGDATAMAQEITIMKMTLDTLQQTNIALRADNILKQQQLAEVVKERDTLKDQLSAFAISTVRGNAPIGDSSELANQLKAAQAKLAVYEAKAIPFTDEEKALIKQPVQQREPDLKVTMTAPKKKPTEFAPGTGPVVEEAVYDLNNGKYDRAEKKFQDVLRQDEKNLYVLSHLAAAQMAQNHLDDAEKTLQKAMAVDPEDGGSLSVMGQLRYYQEKYDAAVESLSLAAKANPDDARVQYFLGRALLQKGQRASAETALRKAVLLADRYGEAHYWLAFIYATANPPFTQLARYHYYEKALKNGYAPNKDFEKLLDKAEPAATPAPATKN